MSSTLALNISLPKQSDLPPMLTQYLEFKERHPECLMLFQVGDFYEVFFEDAKTVAQRLNLTLTSRDKNSEDPVPMCGVPIGAVDGYIERLVDAGFAVAVVSQINSSSMSRLPTAYKEENLPSKISIQRQLTRIVTPGVRLSSAHASSALPKYLAAVALGENQRLAVASTDPQSGIIYVSACHSIDQALEELARIKPSELILPALVKDKHIDRRSTWVRSMERLVDGQALRFRPAHLTSTLKDRLGAIDGFRSSDPLVQSAVQLLVGFVDEATVSSKVKFFKVEDSQAEDHLVIAASARANLELFEASSGSGAGTTVSSVIDRTSSVGGKRQLAQSLGRPLIDVNKINQRFDAVEWLLSIASERSRLRSFLSKVPDLERIAARLELGSVSPRELGAAKNCLNCLDELSNFFSQSSQTPELLRELSKDWVPERKLVELLDSALQEDPPLSINEGGIIRDGWNAELDSLRSIQREGREWVAEIERREQQATGIPSLRVKFNYVLGFFIEVTKSHASKVPERFQRRQGTTSAERYVTTELKERESSVLTAHEKALSLERSLFSELREKLEVYSMHIRTLGKALASLDVLLSFAEIAEAEAWVRPEVNDGTELIIEGGKHPVVANNLKGAFVPNSLRMGDGQPRCFIVTGPNMGGKSTYLRQAGLIVILAQMGSYVPAKRARIGVVDQVFARIGASDNIAGGESTFMVEMREAAEILNRATQKSLLLVDELGRGTATRDGVALAQAILEWLVDRLDCRLLFATHFHDLTKLETVNPMIGNLSVAAVQQGDEVVFTHEICHGPASQSYGIEVAKLAGLPAEVTQRSSDILQQTAESIPATQLSLFKGVPRSASRSAQKTVAPAITLPVDYVELQELRKRVKEINTNNLTPLQALNALANLKETIK